MQKNRRLKTLLECSLFFPSCFLVRLLPRKAALSLGRGLGRIAGHLLPTKRRVALENMGKAFPELSDAEVRQQVDSMFIHLGQSAIEMLRLDLFSDDDIREIFIPRGLENLREAFELNRGVILLSGHLGFWEIGTFLFPKLGFSADFVTKKMRNPYIDAYITRMRESAGGSCIDSRNGARRIIRSLSDKKGVGVLIDQHRSPSEAVSVPFFDRPAFTTPIIARLAMKHQIPVVPVFGYRTEDDRYDVHIRPMLVLKDEPEATVEENTALLTSIIEEAIRQDAAQWLWIHRRWRTP
jgi:Kdo2-lipid IVA lauroyltransferase/acyltransferase